MSDYSKCPFCEMGEQKRMLIFRLVRNLSRYDIVKLSKIHNDEKRYKALVKKSKELYDKEESICPKCGKNCGNKGLLAMHMKSPGRGYRPQHRKYDEEHKND